MKGLKKNLKNFGNTVVDVIKLGKEAYSKDLHCYNYEPVKKRKAIQKLSEWGDGKLKLIFYLMLLFKLFWKGVV